MDTITASLKHFIETNILTDNLQISEDTVLQEIGLDSFSIVEIILFIERKFDLLLPDELLVPETFTSLNTLTQAIHSCQV